MNRALAIVLLLLPAFRPKSAGDARTLSKNDAQRRPAR
jgi:hypothetical protein